MKIFKKYANTIIDLAEDTVLLSDGKKLKSRGYVNTKQFYKDCTGVISCISLNMISLGRFCYIFTSHLLSCFSFQFLDSLAFSER